MALGQTLQAGPRDAQWKAVEEARHKGLPKTAIEDLDPIIKGCLAEGADAEAVKAIALRATLEAEIQGNRPEVKIRLMQAELEKAPVAMRPVMEVLLADWFWHYFLQNRWSFAGRTPTWAASDNFETWDLKRIFAEIDRHFTAALANAEALKAIPIGAYNPLIPPGSVPDAYRPTLFDFLANDALQFYEAGEQAGVEPEDGFELSADSPIFDGEDAFEKWKPATGKEGSPTLKAIRLHQTLLRIHRSDRNRSAFYDTDLDRITFGHNAAVGEDKAGRYKAALRQFMKVAANHEIYARAVALLAGEIDAEGDRVAAHALALRGLDAFPDTAGGATCYNLIRAIEEKSVQMTTESVWNAPWPTLNIEYRNVTKVYFRAIPVDFKKEIERGYWGFGMPSIETSRAFSRMPPALQWSEDLPPTPDFKNRTERRPVPTALKPGYYFIISSFDSSFSLKDGPFDVTGVWVSDLALILRPHYDGQENDGLVLNAISGEPVVGATVHVLGRTDDGRLREAETTSTDKDGRFGVSPGTGFWVLVEAGDQKVSNLIQAQFFASSGAPRSESGIESATLFFTDRVIYRPGQTIRYKGVTIQRDLDHGEYSAVAGRSVTVVFEDTGGKEIARQEKVTNDFGSISGEFVAPLDRLTGQMSINDLKSETSATFRVEEYKRPKFQVEVGSPEAAAKLGAPISLTGNATAYTGAAVGGAKVSWRVERDVALAYWCWWAKAPSEKAIAHGATVTATDGTFTVRFLADPDPAVSAKNEPTFTFTLFVDVTDTAGETRSTTRTVRVGYTSIQALVVADEWETPDKPVQLALATRTLDGVPMPSEGVVTVRALNQPPRVVRAPLGGENRQLSSDAVEPGVDGSNPDSWTVGPVVATERFKTNDSGKAQVSIALKAGIYRASLECRDSAGATATARQVVRVTDPGDSAYRVKVPSALLAPKWTVEPGETFKVVWGTGYDSGRALIEFRCNGRLLKRFWTTPGRTQEIIELPITEQMRGGVSMEVSAIRENRAYLNEATVEVPWSNKKLDLRWEHFRSKLAPGGKETWTAIVTDPEAKRCPAEVAATLYDASLDLFAPRQWPPEFDVFRQESIQTYGFYMNMIVSFRDIGEQPGPLLRVVDWRYRDFPAEITSGAELGEAVALSPFVVDAENHGSYRASATLAGTRVGPGLMADASTASVVTAQFLERRAKGPYSEPEVTATDLSRVTARTNLSETAFFYPHLLAGDDGVVKIVFTVPEALTEWRFLAFAHDRNLRSGCLEGRAVTAKDLMIEPNPPRFLREGDAIEFAVKVSNRTDQPQAGRVKLTFADAATLQSKDEALGNRETEQAFEVPARQSRTYSWRIVAPDGLGVVTYKAVGATSKLSDGEEGYLPVLSRQVLVTESLPLPIRGKTTRDFEFRKLLESGESSTIRNRTLTVQMVSQPAWYAVMALPYLMEFPHECNEQTFNRLYSNALARHIAESDPKIRRIFDLWKETDALQSPLDRNKDLRSVAIEETPWVREAEGETQARRNLGILFDANRLKEETERLSRVLADRQLGDGLWPWFPGGASSPYISLYIATGFGRLRHLGVEIDATPALKALDALDRSMDDRYRDILRRPHSEAYVPSSLDALYLYGRSFFLEDHPISGDRRKAVDFFLGQSRRFWLKAGSLQTQAHLALALHRFGDRETPAAILRSIKERGISDAEIGMYWPENGGGWWWYQAPIETQAMMIEAFDEISGDSEAVEACKVWLLKQKEMQSWKTTKATADAVYALLLRGENLLASDARVEVSLGGVPVRPDHAEAGTGFYEQHFVRGEIKPPMGRITVKKDDSGISWGGVYWQYLEDIGKVTPSDDKPLKLTKRLFVKESTSQGQVLRPVTGPLNVGDELVVRIELFADRDMEFIHLKDQRASGTEPVDVLSGYRYQDGLSYYESTRDTATHFFIDYLPKGTYVFEYSTRVQLKGAYQTGYAEIESMYAPEFGSHSESLQLQAK